MLSSVLQRRYLPETWDDAKFYVPAAPIKAVMETRGGVKMFVGYEPLQATRADRLKQGDVIQAAWAVNGVDVLPRMQYEPRRPQHSAIRLRLHGNERLDLKQRPEEFIFATRAARDAFFDKQRFHDLLTRVLRVPFRSPDDWFTEGYDATYEGVRVFHGQVVSREWGIPVTASNRDKVPPHWWDRMELFVTDSDPQYFCVQITLREQDEPLGGK